MMMLAAGAKAYSGPTDGSRWEAHLRAGNDVGFAFIVALLFGMAFALDALRLPGLEDRLSAGLALLMYTATVAVTVGSVWQRAGP